MSASLPPFHADQVGSLIRPQSLFDAYDARDQGTISASRFREVQQDAIREAVRRQEAIGLRAVTDGEFNRTTWQTDFLVRFENVQPVKSRFTITFHNEQGDTEGSPHTLQVTGRLARPRAIFVDDFRFLSSIATAVPKITMPSPSVMHFRGGRDAIDAHAYPDMDGFYQDLARVYQEEIADLADAGCRYLQLDEVNFAYLCDPALRAQVQTNIGEDPDRLPQVYARLINDTIARRPDDMRVCLHVCRGNFAGNWMAEGGYDPVAEVLFNEVDVDGYFLEYDSARAGGFEPLRFVPRGKVVVLGLVTTKKGELEQKDDLKRRIEEASRFLSLEQLALSPQCGFASGMRGATMSIEQQFAKLALVVDVAREVWGTV